MMRVMAWTWAALTLLVLLPATAFAQASITGVVRDSQGAVLPGVTVEAASPEIIEKVRTAVTDGSGTYRITELRPGAYTVTFTLRGFNTVKRDGINLTGAFTASVDGEMRVGALEETITVTGESPIVDVQSATIQRVMDADDISRLPTGRNMFELGILLPGVSMVSQGGTLANHNVGGALGPETRALGAHGGRTEDQRFMMNGVSLSSMIGGGWGGGAIPNATGLQEIVFDTAAVSAELATGGVRINFIAREGSNQFHGSVFSSFANSSMQGTNIGSDLLARNAALVNAGGIDKNWDLNPGFGGPIKQDKLWFFASGRYQGANLFAPGMFYNQNANDPTKWDYVADTSRPAKIEKVWRDAQLRLSWQAAPKHKIGVTYTQQDFCACHDAVSATVAPEAANDRRFPTQRVVLLDWTSPVTNRVLIEASGIHRVERWGNMHLQTKGLTLDPAMIGVVEQGGTIPGLRYRGAVESTPARAGGTYNNSWNNNFHWRFHVSYVTGAHAFKVGVNDAYGYHENQSYVPNPVSYRFNNGVPNEIVLRALPHTVINHVDNDFGLFAQDKWTIDRLTVSAGIRYDHHANTFPEQILGPTFATPNRNITFPEQKNLSYHDITPKSQLVYDLFGNGKTALKVSLNKYLAGLGTTNGATPVTLGPNPINVLNTVVRRNWTDANGNKVPDCNLLSRLEQDNRAKGGDLCSAFEDATFGLATPNARFDPDLLRGWGKRYYNWEFSTGVQHEILPRVSLDVAFFRRWYGNFVATDNLNVAASEYDSFSVVAPADSRLPNGGGYTVSGFKNLNPSAFGRAADNFTTLADTYGKQIEHWNGVDVNVNARLANGLSLQGGGGTGRTSTDNCDIVDDVPEAATVPPVAGTASLVNFPYCHVDTNWLTSIKGSASYTIPRVDVVVTGTFQRIPAPVPYIAANWAAPNSAIQPSLGRPLSGAAQNQTVNLVEPGTLFGPALKQLDFRVAKILRFGTARTTINFDLYNALNANSILTYNDNFSVGATGAVTWQQPTQILQARFFKISAQLDW